MIQQSLQSLRRAGHNRMVARTEAGLVPSGEDYIRCPAFQKPADKPPRFMLQDSSHKRFWFCHVVLAKLRLRRAGRQDLARVSSLLSGVRLSTPQLFFHYPCAYCWCRHERRRHKLSRFINSCYAQNSLASEVCMRKVIRVENP